MRLLLLAIMCVCCTASEATGALHITTQALRAICGVASVTGILANSNRESDAEAAFYSDGDGGVVVRDD